MAANPIVGRGPKGVSFGEHLCHLVRFDTTEMHEDAFWCEGLEELVHVNCTIEELFGNFLKKTEKKEE
jgi:hypothetical protein